MASFLVRGSGRPDELVAYAAFVLDTARATRLRNLGLEPADVDPRSGYRMYATAQVPRAQLIRRFRDLDMPIDEVRVVLDAPDVAERDRAILGHLERMERELGRDVLAISAVTGQGLAQLVGAVAQLLHAEPSEVAPQA